MLKKAIKIVKKNIRNIQFKQVLVIFLSSFVLILLGFVIKNIQTTQLGNKMYGEYALFITITSFLSLFFRFGFFESIQNLLAQNNNLARRNHLAGVGFIVALGTGILLSVAVWGVSFFVDQWFHSNIGTLLRLFAPLTLTLMFKYLFTAYSLGTNRIYIDILYEILPKTLLLILLYIGLQEQNLSLTTILFYNLITSLTIVLLFFVLLKPKFNKFFYYSKLVWIKNKKYGFEYYKGAIANQTTYNIDGLLISFYYNPTLIGYYSLAQMITSPMVSFGQAISKALFRKYAYLKAIPKEVFVINTTWLAGSVIFFYFFSDKLVSLLFGSGFEQVAEYTLWMSLVLVFHGLTTPFTFLAAKSRGNDIKKVAYLEASFNLLGNLTLIPFFGVYGAILTSFLSKLANFIYFSYLYRQFLKTGNSKNGN